MRALITGITGQDGSYLAELLLEKGYEVHGTVRRTSNLERSRLQHLYENTEIYGKRLFLHYADIDDATNLRRVLTKVKPTEIYHLAGQSHVGLSFEMPELTCELSAMGTLRILEMVRDLNPAPKFFHAASSEIFGRPDDAPQNEETKMLPVNPYGVAKAFARNMVSVYRDCFGMFACNGILYNHESPRRGENFVTRKICRGVAKIKLGLESDLKLGDTSAMRDWGYAPDYVHGMWLALQHEKADDYVFATGQLHRVQDIVEIAFNFVGLDWTQYVKQDERFMRPAEPLKLVGDSTRARTVLGWNPAFSFKQLIETMVSSELDSLKARTAYDASMAASSGN